jgi:hypothetical protein
MVQPPSGSTRRLSSVPPSPYGRLRARSHVVLMAFISNSLYSWLQPAGSTNTSNCHSRHDGHAGGDVVDGDSCARRLTGNTAYVRIVKNDGVLLREVGPHIRLLHERTHVQEVIIPAHLRLCPQRRHLRTATRIWARDIDKVLGPSYLHPRRLLQGAVDDWGVGRVVRDVLLRIRAVATHLRTDPSSLRNNELFAQPWTIARI